MMLSDDIMVRTSTGQELMYSRGGSVEFKLPGKHRRTEVKDCLSDDEE